jgi:hypothetical protein
LEGIEFRAHAFSFFIDTSVIGEFHRKKWFTFYHYFMFERSFASVDILDISERERVLLPFFERKSEDSSIGSEGKILD